MAIGFPPSNTISPSVRIIELDLSFIAPEQTFHRAGLVGFASKGPINVPTNIATSRQLHITFGYPHPDVGDPYLVYAAEQYLLVGSELFVVRVAQEDAVNDEAAITAEKDIPAAGGQVVIQSDTAGPYSFSADSFFRWRLNGILSSKTLLVSSDAHRASPDTGTAYTCAELVEELNLQLDAETDGIQFFCSTDSKIGISTTFAFGPDATLEIVSVQNSIYGGAVIDGNVTGLGTGMTVASTTGSNDRYPEDSYQTAGTWEFHGLTSTALDLNIVIDGTDNVLIDNVVQTVDLSALVNGTQQTSDIVDEINAQIAASNVPGGFEASATGDNLTISTLHYGRDARLLVKSDSPGFNIFKFNGLTAKGTSPSGAADSVSVETFGIVSGTTNSAGTVTFTLKADTPGIDGNATQVVVANDTRDGVFSLDVYNNGAQVEHWGNLTKDSSSSFYIATYLTLVSQYIKATDNTATSAPPLAGTYTLAGGTDGIPADSDEQDGLLIGSDVGMTGIYALSDPEQYDVDLLAIPGHASTSVITALLDVCELRHDCLGVVDPPFGLTVNEIIQWQNGAHPLNTTRFDSNFGALYWPWVKLTDTFNRVDVWVPPSGSVMAAIARSDSLGKPWFAPAGEIRGMVPGITDVFSRPTLPERDSMYGFRNAVNPIVQFTDVDGFVIMGQKTLQRTPTALDRVNVRRLLFVLQKRIRQEARHLLFDPNDDEFRQKFVNIATAICREVQVGRGLTDFIVKADTELNTPDVIDRNEFRARIGVQPTRAAEFMFLEFSVHRTGSFAAGDSTF